MVHMYENVFRNWAVHSFKCLFFAYYILLHLLLMHFHPAGSVQTGTQVLLRHHILQFPSADAASYPSSWQRYFKTDQAQTCGNNMHITAYKRTHGQRHHPKEQPFSWKPSQAALSRESVYIQTEAGQAGIVCYLFASLLFTVTEECSE